MAATSCIRIFSLHRYWKHLRLKKFSVTPNPLATLPSVPFPDVSVQPHLFDTVLGIVIDRQNKLWSIDNGNHGFGNVRLIALDLEDQSIVHDYEISAEIVPSESFYRICR